MNRFVRILVYTALLFAAIAWVQWAHAAECLKDQKACKVIIVTPEQADSMKKLIESTNINGPYAQIKQAVDFYVDIIDKAPAGTTKDPEKPAPAVEPKKP